MKQLTVAHQAVFNFKTAADQYRPVTETDVAQEDYRDFYDYFTGAISNFINSELNFRQGARCASVGINPDLQSYSDGLGEQLNTEGIGYLVEALICFNNFRDEQVDLPVIGADFQPILADYKTRLRETMVLLEIKGSDALELSNEIEAVTSKLVAGNTGQQLLEYIAAKVQQLADVRSQPGRGAESNIAIWKLIAAAVMLGLASWVVYKCYYSQRLCSKREKAIYNSILAVAMIVFGACE